MLTILIDIDAVTIEGVVIKRPDRIARSAWLAFWEQVRTIEPDEPE